MLLRRTVGNDMTEEWHKQETYKSMVSISVEAFKYLALLNGGAAVGVLAAFDRLTKWIPVYSLQVAMACFIAGLLLDGMAMFCSYLTQLILYGEDMGWNKKRRHLVFLIVAFIFCALSLLTFSVGAISAVMSAS